MDNLEDLKKQLEEERPVGWQDFPDINLYKDQVIVYLKRQLINTEGDGHLTPAMISNYVKDKLIPKAIGKKYDREHLALLTEISILKQVLTVKDISFLLNEKYGKKNIEESYEEMLNHLDRGLIEVAKRLGTEGDKDKIIDMALKFAIESYASKLVCEKLIAIVRDEKKDKNEKDK